MKYGTNQKNKVKMKRDYSTGVILYRKEHGINKYLILKHRQGHWAFSKGHGKTNEQREATALRELFEETGIKNVNLISNTPLIEENYIFKNRKGEEIIKKVEYFIGKTEESNIKTDSKEISDYKWAAFSDAIATVTYKESKSTLIKANEIISEYNKNASINNYL